MGIEKDPLILSGDFQYALDQLEKTSSNLFVTGKAGTGKSTLLQLFRATTGKKSVVVAPTGVAALNVKGQTIHSFFGFPPRPINKSDIKKRRFRKLYENLEVLIVDEISMVRADMLDNMDYFLRLNRNNPQPFGGVQVVFFGDLFQLPPVVSSPAEKMLFQSHYESPYFFSAKVFEQGFHLEMLELRQVYRQEARHFLHILDAVRLNQTDEGHLEDLNNRYFPNFEAGEFFITLSARNHTVNSINESALSKIESPAVVFPARIHGQFNPLMYPTEAQLTLKKDAQVMFLKNDPDKRFVNGTIGKVVDLGNDHIEVLIEQGGKKDTIEVERADWEIVKYKPSDSDPNRIEAEVLGSFEQYPLKLAWAITIHKSQGKTFDKVIIDLGRGAFEHGQTYVALSRCRSLEGIILKKPLRMQDILVDERIVEYYESNLR